MSDEFERLVHDKLDAIGDKIDDLAKHFTEHIKEDEKRLTALETKQKWTQWQFRSLWLAALSGAGWLFKNLLGDK